MDQCVGWDDGDGGAAFGHDELPAQERTPPSSGTGVGKQRSTVGQAMRGRARRTVACENTTAALAAAAGFERTAPCIPLGRLPPGQCALTCAYSSMWAHAESIAWRKSEGVTQSVCRYRQAVGPRRGLRMRGKCHVPINAPSPSRGMTGQRVPRRTPDRGSGHETSGNSSGAPGKRSAQQRARDSSGSNQPLL